jgi:hypothetical protein
VEACEEDATDTDVMLPSAVKSPAPTADATKGMPNDSNDDRSPDRAIGDSSSGGDKASLP